jgi:SAM-dependent methyltransferase
MDSKARLINLNAKQRAFYESKAVARTTSKRALNLPTYLWTRLREAQQRSERGSGVSAAMLEKHREWLSDLSDKDVLDLGCFSGNRLSIELAQAARSYLGIDLCAQAIDQLRKKLVSIPGAEAQAVDFLAEGYRNRFDVIYAHSVLHHFDDFELLCKELRRALRPGGLVVSLDPLQTDPINRLARLAYRPFQADKDWEWPFDGRNFAVIREHFEIEAVQGFRGLSKLGPLAGPWAPQVARCGCNQDLKHADRFGLPLTLCWIVAMKLRKPATLP